MSLEEPLVDILRLMATRKIHCLYPVFEVGNLKELNTRIDVIQLLMTRYSQWSADREATP